MTFRARATLAALVAAAYLVCSWPLAVVSLVSVMTLFGGTPDSMLVLMPLYWAVLGLPAFAVAWAFRKRGPGNLGVVTGAVWAWVVGALFVAATMLGDPLRSDDALSWLLAPSTTIAGVFAGGVKGGQSGSLLLVCFFAGVGAFVATFLPGPVSAADPGSDAG